MKLSIQTSNFNEMELVKICLLVMVGLLATSALGKPLSNKTKSIDHDEPENEASTKSQIMDEINSTTEKGAQKRGIDWTIIIVNIVTNIVNIVVVIIFIVVVVAFLRSL